MSLRYYTGLLRDRPRIEGMREGIRAAVRKGDRVLDLGTGLGTYAFFAVEAGAAEVVAVDRNPVVHLAESMALANGMADRIRFVRGDFPMEEVTGPFDVVIFEDYTSHLMGETVFNLLQELRRVAGPAARFVPGRGRLQMCPVDQADLHREMLEPAAGLDEWHLAPSVLRDFLAHSPFRTHVAQPHLLGEPATSPPIDLSSPDGELFRVAGEWTVEVDATLHGVVAWVDLELAPGRWLTESGIRENIWGHQVFPLDPPVEVAAGAKVAATLWSPPQPSGAPGPWCWEVRSGGEVRVGNVIAGSLFGPPELDGGPSGTSV